jgi:hypothetical protein
MTRLPAPILAATLALAAGCDSSGPAGPSTNPSPHLLFVSDAVVESGSSGTVAYVSVAPGGVGGATGAVIESSDGTVVPVVSLEGGFDPVGVRAKAGDTLEIRFTLAGGGMVAPRAAVPASRRPRVVRTQPARGRRDVALNSVIGVVFSEPMDPATVGDSTVRLLKDGVAVPGTVQPAAGTKSAFEFAPAAPLEPAATYQLVLDGSLRDLTGDPLEPTEPVEFTTFEDGGLGQLTVITRTTGGVDPDGFDLMVDGRFAMHLEPSDSVEVPGVGAGGHQVTLSGISANCFVTNGVWRQVQVVTTSGTRVEFDVACPALTLDVTTSGPDADADGYQVLVNGQVVRDVPSNGTFPLPGLTYGFNTIELTSIRGNCGDVQSARRFITPEPGDATLEASFEIQCAADFVPTGTIAFAASSGTSHTSPSAIVVANADGSNRLQLTDALARNVMPTWAPDGERIAFLRDAGLGVDLYLVDALGGNLLPRLTGFFRFVNSVAWLPDGRIVLKGTTLDMSETGAFALDPDGNAAPTPVYSGFGLIAWAPSGAEFVRLDGSSLDIFGSDGSFLRNVPAGSSNAYWWGPFWTSSEHEFALVACSEALAEMDPETELGYCTSYRLELVRANGSGWTSVPLTEPITGPDWSPDGSTIAFSRCSGGGRCIGVGFMRASGSGSSVTIADGFDPAWKP